MSSPIGSLRWVSLGLGNDFIDTGKDLHGHIRANLHRSLKTTMIRTHPARLWPLGTCSPLDRLR